MNKTMIDSVQKAIVLTDYIKFGKRGFGKICSIHDVDMLITDDGITDLIQQHIVDQPHLAHKCSNQNYCRNSCIVLFNRF